MRRKIKIQDLADGFAIGVDRQGGVKQSIALTSVEAAVLRVTEHAYTYEWEDTP